MQSLQYATGVIQGYQIRREARSIWERFEDKLSQDVITHIQSNENLPYLFEELSSKLLLPELKLNEEETRRCREIVKVSPNLIRSLPSYGRKEKYVAITFPLVHAISKGSRKKSKSDSFDKWEYAVGYAGTISAEFVDNVADNEIPSRKDVKADQWVILYKAFSLLSYKGFEDTLNNTRTGIRDVDDRLESLFKKSHELIIPHYRRSIDVQNIFTDVNTVKSLYDRTTAEIVRLALGSAPVDELSLSFLLERLGGNLGNWLVIYDELEDLVGRQEGNKRREPRIPNPSIFLAAHGRQEPTNETVSRAFYETCSQAEFHRYMLEDDVRMLPNGFKTKPFMELMLRLARNRLDKERERFVEYQSASDLIPQMKLLL